MIAAFAVVVAAGAMAGTAGAAWTLVGSNLVASTPTTGGGYPVPPGSRVPEAGTCGPGPFNANHSESWIAVKPGTEDLPPSWTDTTDPNLDFDTGDGGRAPVRVYQTMLPFNAFWDATKLHPDGEIDVSYSDDMGRTWVKGNGGKALEPPNNASAKQFGHVEDKQWIAVNHILGNINQDHVYAAWSVFNGSATKVRMAVSRDRGLTFGKAVTISLPSQVGPAVTYVYPEIDAAGFVYVSVVSFPPNGGASTIYVARSADDGHSFGPFVAVTTVNMIPTAGLPNTRFREGITESFAASPMYPGHLYLTYE